MRIGSLVKLSAVWAVVFLTACSLGRAASPNGSAGLRSENRAGTPVVPLQQFFDNPVAGRVRISPDGEYLAFPKPYQGKLNVHIRARTGGPECRITADTVRAIERYQWSPDSRHILYLQDSGGNRRNHVYAAPVGEGCPGAVRDLTPYQGISAAILDAPPQRSGRVLITMNRRDPAVHDAYWLDPQTGEATIAARNPGGFFASTFLADDQGQVRVGISRESSGSRAVHVRPDSVREWRVLLRYPAEDEMTPLRFHPDGQRVYALSNRDSDLRRLVLLDLRDGTEAVVASDPENVADLSEAIFAPGGELLLTRYTTDTTRVYGHTPEMRSHLARMRRLHPGPMIVDPSRGDGGRYWMVYFYAPTDPGAYYLYDGAKHQGELILRSRPWFTGAPLPSMQPVRFRSRDGLTIHGYLSLPRDVPAEALPMVVLVHGGPWSGTDVYGYNREAAFHASRGYAVLQVNYRGSRGYGRKFLEAAVGEFARGMHDDLVDGVRWAVEQGIADPGRVAIVGESFGGYSALVGLTRTPEVFACGVDLWGPSSLVTLLESFPAGTNLDMWYRFAGHPADRVQRRELIERSPLYFAHRIEDPLLIVQGENDPLVKRQESDQMVVALHRRGVQVDYLLVPDEGHGIRDPLSRMAVYRAMEVFLGRCLDGRVQTEVAPSVEQRMQELRADPETLQPSSASGR